MNAITAGDRAERAALRCPAHIAAAPATIVEPQSRKPKLVSSTINGAAPATNMIGVARCLASPMNDFPCAARRASYLS